MGIYVRLIALFPFNLAVLFYIHTYFCRLIAPSSILLWSWMQSHAASISVSLSLSLYSLLVFDSSRVSDEHQSDDATRTRTYMHSRSLNAKVIKRHRRFVCEWIISIKHRPVWLSPKWKMLECVLTHTSQRNWAALEKWTRIGRISLCVVQEA